MSSKGCKGNAADWDCFAFESYDSVFGAAIGDTPAEWQFLITVGEGEFPDGLDFKVHYLNSDGSRNGGDGGTIYIPEPSTLILLSSGLLIGAAIRIRFQ